MIALSLAAATSLAQYPAREGEPAVHVRIETDSPRVALFRVTGDTAGVVTNFRTTAFVGMVHYRRECAAPCELPISGPHSEFFVAGEGITPSRRFSLMGEGEDITLRVKPGSAAMRTGGWVATALGISALVLGGTLYAMDGMLSGGKPSLADKPGRFDMVGWAGLMGGGAALLGGGLTLMAFSGTDVELLPSRRPTPVRMEVL